MGKAERIRQMNARQRIAEQQAAARRAEARRRMYLASGSVLGVIAIVIGLIVWKSAGSNSASASSEKPTAAVASLVEKQITTVPAATLNAVGKGSNVNPLTPTQGKPAVLTSGGKPQVLYMGALYCPYCGAERWAMAVALSRFGSFSNIGLTSSSKSDVYPNTPTLSFYKSTYTSKYIDFTPVELYSTKELNKAGVYAALMKPTSVQVALMSKYDAPPYVQSTYAGSYPFLDIGNQYVDIGAQYLPSSLAHLTWTQIAADIRNPNSSVAQGVDGAANSITAAICKITNNAPAAVCASAGAQAGAGSL
jgi:Domain of unknown function (DUF929)